MAIVLLIVVAWVAFVVLGVVYMIFEPLLWLLGRGIVEIACRLRRRICGR
jgi:hypothetical protein